MQGSIFTFKNTAKTIIAQGLFLAAATAPAYADGPQRLAPSLIPSWKSELSSVLVAASPSNGKDRSLPSDEEDFTNTPFTEYGEFNEEEDEEEESKFLQYGRLFGVSIFAGQETALGDRGKLWQGGFPLVGAELYYWFDFHFALDLGFTWVQQFFETTTYGHTNITLYHAYLGVRYYFDTKNLSAPISFANPYLLLDVGEYNKSQFSEALQTTDTETQVGITAGAGLEFPIVLRKTYFDLQLTFSQVTFNDTYAPEDPSLTDLTGLLFTVTGGIVFTW